MCLGISDLILSGCQNLQDTWTHVLSSDPTLCSRVSESQGAVQVQTEAKKPKPRQLLGFCETNVSRCPEGKALHPYQSSLYAKFVSP